MNATACFHCGEPNPAAPVVLARVQGRERAVCCPGCKAAAEWIDTLGLGDYYRLRSEPALRSDLDFDYSAWDRPALRRLHVREAAADRAEVIVLVDGLRCSACAWLIERAMRGTPGVLDVGVNALARRVVLGFDPRQVALSGLLTALARLGYAPHPLTAEMIDSQRQRESRDAMKRLAVAGLGTMQAMMMAVALYAGVFDGIDPAVREFFRWLGFLVATPVVLYSAQPFFRGALREWRSRRLSMDTPVALAIGLIYAASLVGVIVGGHEIYFDSVSMFVLFLLLGRHLAMRARHRAGDVVDALSRLQPALAERREAAGFVSVAVHELEAGDIVRVASGAAIPADGELRDRSCRIDESLLSGESTPVRRDPGQSVIAGSLVIDGPIEIVVRRIGADTVLAGIVRMVTQAASERPRLARVADARAARFVLRVLGVTVLTALAWTWFDPARALPAALAVLVVSCPCAFALAVPAALTRAVAVLAERGVLVVDADALEALATADRFVFDKTGTLTEPSFDREDIEIRRGTLDDALGIAAALEQGSTHPLALALRRMAASAPVRSAERLRQIAGAGVEGDVGGIHYRLGREEFALAGGASEFVTQSDALVLADESGEIARFVVGEQPRADAAGLIRGLMAQGIACEILSGDCRTRVDAVADRLGIGDRLAKASPADKLARLEALREAGHVVAMVGDGINDAPVLAGADVAIAIGNGSAMAHAASGILLASSRIDTLLEARRIAGEMLVRLKQNLAWALAYNLAVVPVAAIGWVPPWLAAIGMSASSIVVILNSLRIGRRPSGPASTAALAVDKPAREATA
ncbi:heavy metal translocating P-type ATPase [Dokdonella immobilis]|uniref:Cu2+-exporting ATPase n=1 Tax=Dokdonella immobilis TaxID=578942 RepID=A0A1I5ADC5_9GAMM|nr:heavy metal translocating P-type ATPase [Dokdonella immobilis]SFN60456.1 Cu2+-exporting ATPase [Dokdonella immobilis]